MQDDPICRSTLDYIADRLLRLMAPLELRTAFSRKNFSQLLMLEGEPPAAAVRLGHADVTGIRQKAFGHDFILFQGASDCCKLPMLDDGISANEIAT